MVNKGRWAYVLLIEDDVLANAIIERMLMAGNKVYNSIMDLQEARDAK